MGDAQFKTNNFPQDWHKEKSVASKEKIMSHIINMNLHSGSFLREANDLSGMDIAQWHHNLKENAYKMSGKDLTQWQIDPIKQMFVMAQTQFTIANLRESIKENILAVLNPAAGSLKVKEQLLRPSFWSYLSQTYNLTPFFIAESINNVLLKINTSSFFSVNPLGIPEFCTFDKGKLSVERSIIPSFYYGDDLYSKCGEDYLYDYNGELRSIANCYSFQGRNIFVFENRSSFLNSDYLCLGRSFLQNNLFGHENLYKFHELPCLIFVNQDVGFEFRQIIQEARNIASSKFHSLACYENIINMNFSELCGRKIIFVCSPDSQQWGDLKNIFDNCRKSGVKSISLYPYPIVGNFCHIGTREIPQEAAELLNKKIIDLKFCERITKVAEHIIVEAIPETQFSSFEKKYSLIKAEPHTAPIDLEDFQFKSWSKFERKDSNKGSLSTRDFINPASTTLIYGPSDSGKSWLIIELCIALASGSGSLGLTPAQPAKVFYCDGEIGDAFSSRILQLTKGKPQAFMKLLDENLLVRSFIESNELLEKKEQFLSVLRKEKPNVLVIDNILSLTPKAWRGQNDNLIDLLRELKTMGIAPIIVHHTNKKGDTSLGSVSLEVLSQNIIRLENLRLQAA